MGFHEIIELLGQGIEAVGVAIIVIGVAMSLGSFAVGWVRTRQLDQAYEQVRHHVARSILLGLELLVAGDIIRTVAIDPTLNSVAVLAGIVLIRTFLSFTLEVEITGRWPWAGGAVANRSPQEEGLPGRQRTRVRTPRSAGNDG